MILDVDIWCAALKRIRPVDDFYLVMVSAFCLARSANLPKGLYILPMFFLLYFLVCFHTVIGVTE